MDNRDFINAAIAAVKDYINEEMKVEVDGEEVTEKDIYISWLSKTIKNNKALLGSEKRPREYFEATYNGNDKEMYLDVYVKMDKKTIKL